MKSHSKSKATIRRDEAAKVRRAARNGRTDEQQLRLLEARGAQFCTEAVRLRARIFNKANPETPVREGEKVTPKASRPVRKRRNKPASLM